MFSLLFKSEKSEKISFQALSETQKQIVESAYKVYFDASEEKTSCNLEEQTQPVLDPETGNPLYLNLEAMSKHGQEFVADGWATFAAYIAKKHQQEAPDMDKTRKAFEEAYKLGAENKNAAVADIAFDKLSEIQKNAWLSSAQFLYNTELEPKTSPTPTCPSL